MIRTAATAALIALLAAPAWAQFEIQDAETEENSVELQSVNTVFFGDVEDQIRSSHEVSVSWGMVHGYEFEFGFGLQSTTGNVDSDPFRGIDFTNTIAIIGTEGFAPSENFALALIAGFSYDFIDSSDVSLTIGPAIEADLGGVDLSSNTFFEIPLGGGEETAFTYALGGYFDVSEDLAVGLEAHGEIPSVFEDTPSLSDQEHFIGPAVAFDFDVEENREIGMRIGSFFGLTDATPTVGLSMNLELGF